MVKRRGMFRSKEDAEQAPAEESQPEPKVVDRLKPHPGLASLPDEPGFVVMTTERAFSQVNLGSGNIYVVDGRIKIHPSHVPAALRLGFKRA